ncbi:MAG: hypothetical protein GX824_04660 [Clostridiales bacterium]|nr:hypothetical protein [Clostridiales bacterium]
MKTLLVYYSNNKDVQGLCESCANGDVDVLRLNERYHRSHLWDLTVGTYRAVSGRGSRMKDININLAEYDSLIISTPVRLMNPHSIINEFLHRTSLSGLEVSALLVHSGNIVGGAADILRKRIVLAGGSCRGVVSITTKELREREYDVLSLAGYKLKAAAGA